MTASADGDHRAASTFRVFLTTVICYRIDLELGVFFYSNVNSNRRYKPRLGYSGAG